jgi:hypothetical protein
LHIYLHLITNLISLIFLGTYKEAREMEIEITNVSTNDEEMFSKIMDKTSQKRPINKPSRFCNSSSSEEDENKNFPK